MRILLIHHSNVVGGAEKSICELISHLTAKGIEFIGILPNGGGLSSVFEDAGATVHKTNIPKLQRTINPLKLASYLKARKRLSAFARKLAQKERADIVHFNSLSAAILFGEEIRDEGIPTLLHLRDSIVPQFVFGQFASGFDAYIAISTYMETVLTKYLAIPPYKVKTVVNGAALPSSVTPKLRAEARKRLKIDEDTVVFLCVAAYVPWKNHSSLINAYKIVMRRIPNSLLITKCNYSVI